jgi:predicted acylesterase/phospholipase RssA
MSEHTTFSQLGKISGCNIFIYATDISLNEPVTFSTTGTPDFPVFKAILASTAIPFIYPPVDNKYVDGFVKNSFPYTELNESETMYFYLSSDILLPKVAGTLQEYVLQVVNTLKTVPKLPKSTIIINCRNITSMSFGVTKKDILRLIKIGFDSI